MIMVKYSPNDGLGDVEDVDLALGEGCGHSGDDAFVVDACDGEDDLHGVLLVVWGCVPNEEVHKGTGTRIFIRAIIGYPEHTVQGRHKNIPCLPYSGHKKSTPSRSE